MKEAHLYAICTFLCFIVVLFYAFVDHPLVWRPASILWLIATLIFAKVTYNQHDLDRRWEELRK